MQKNEIIKRKASLQEDRYNKSLYIPKIIYENKPLITEQNQKILSKNLGIIDKIEGKNLGLKNTKNIKMKIEKIFHKPHSKTLSMYEKIRICNKFKYQKNYYNSVN